MFDLTYVSHATREVLSIVRQASSTASEMVSATLSGWPSPTDSEEKMYRLLINFVCSLINCQLHIDVSRWDDISVSTCVNWFLKQFCAIKKMSSTLKSLRALSDPTRLRIISLLEKDELTVNELQEITRMGQPRISTHLGLLQDSELVQSRRDGKRTFYRLFAEANDGAAEFIDLAIRGAKELPEHDSDQINL